MMESAEKMDSNASSFIGFLSGAKWLNETTLLVILVITGILSPFLFDHSARGYILETFFPDRKKATPKRRQISGFVPNGPQDLTTDHPRTEITETEVLVFGWPSKGGVIILENADAIDFDFLSLDRLNPPAGRYVNQQVEDSFCRYLFKLGGKWWTSEERFLFIKGLQENHELSIGMLENGDQAPPTERERVWTSVGWASSGGFWVLEYELQMWGHDSKSKARDEAARLKLASTMDERCDIIRRHLGGKFFAKAGEYNGKGFLKSGGD